MNIRQEVEKAVAGFAASKSIPVAYEGVAFDKPSDKPFLTITFVGHHNHNASVDGLHTRKRGIFQVEAYVPTGKGMKSLDTLTEEIVALFPAHRKDIFQEFSVERRPEVSSAFQDGTFMCAVVRVEYRQELVSS